MPSNRQGMALSASAIWKPKASVRGGIASAANTPPAGTPACLIEKMMLRRRAGVCPCSICDEQGLLNAYPIPMSSEPAIMTGRGSGSQAQHPDGSAKQRNLVEPRYPPRFTRRPATEDAKMPEK